MIAAHACPAKVAIVAAVTKSGRTCGDDSAVQALLVEDSLPEKPPPLVWACALRSGKYLQTEQ